MIALRGVFFFCLGLLVLGFATRLIMKERKLYANLTGK
jgi:hypothetical protein